MDPRDDTQPIQPIPLVTTATPLKASGLSLEPAPGRTFMLHMPEGTHIPTGGISIRRSGMTAVEAMNNMLVAR